jgi:hypothetical protein
MSTKFENGSVVTDNTLQFMKPAVEDNATVGYAQTQYIFHMYVENDPYTGDSYWTGYEDGPDFDSDEKAIAHLHKLKNKQIRPNYPDTYKKCELIICKTLKTEERIVLED